MLRNNYRDGRKMTIIKMMMIRQMGKSYIACRINVFPIERLNNVFPSVTKLNQLTNKLTLE